MLTTQGPLRINYFPHGIPTPHWPLIGVSTGLLIFYVRISRPLPDGVNSLHSQCLYFLSLLSTV
jgi:hypothetical protein